MTSGLLLFCFDLLKSDSPLPDSVKLVGCSRNERPGDDVGRTRQAQRFLGVQPVVGAAGQLVDRFNHAKAQTRHQ